MKNILRFMSMFLIVIIVAFICIGCSSKEMNESKTAETTIESETISKTENQSVGEAYKSSETEVNMSTMLIGMDIYSANRMYLNSFHSKTETGVLEGLNSAKSFLEDAKNETKKFLPEKNGLTNQLDKLIGYYESIEEGLKGSENIDEDKLIELVRNSGDLYLKLLYISIGYSSLYNIRLYDMSLKEDGRWTLDQLWTNFLFDGECPNEITVDEIYSMWAEQYVDDENKAEFNVKLENLRQKDDTLDKEVNAEWLMFIEKFISIEKVAGQVPATFSFISNIMLFVRFDK